MSDKKQDTYKSRRRVVAVDAGHRQPPQVDFILFFILITSIYVYGSAALFVFSNQSRISFTVDFSVCLLESCVYT